MKNSPPLIARQPQETSMPKRTVSLKDHTASSRTDAHKPALPGRGGKLVNDANKEGHQAPTQKHEGKRTPLSRSDRESHIGADNQARSRKGGLGSPSGEGR
jgi:hypothetical protein